MLTRFLSQISYNYVAWMFLFYLTKSECSKVMNISANILLKHVLTFISWEQKIHYTIKNAWVGFWCSRSVFTKVYKQQTLCNNFHWQKYVMNFVYVPPSVFAIDSRLQLWHFLFDCSNVRPSDFLQSIEGQTWVWVCPLV